MTFNQMVFKMLKANLRRYLLYYLCSSFTVMILFTYSTLLSNKDFTNPYKVNSSISSNLIAPGIVLLAFSVFFIFYTQNAFDKYRKSEFGLFMVLGLTHKNIAKMIALENGIVAAISILTGLVAGTVFSGAFYLVLIKIIGIRGVSFSLTIQSYLYTSVLFILLYILVISYSMLSSLMYEITTMLKESRKEEKNWIVGLVAGIIGILAIVAAAFDMLCNFKTGYDEVFLRSLLLCSAGIYLLISNLVLFLKKILRYHPKKYYCNMLFIANLKYTFGKTKKILFLISLLTGITIFFGSAALILGADSERFAVQHNPFHIAYVEISGKNNIPKETLDSIANNGETPLVSHIRLEYMDKGTKSIFSDKALNEAFGTTFQVRKGKFINLLQIVENDGYTYNTDEMRDFEINSENGFSEYVSQGSVKKMLFNNLLFVSKGRHVILNDEDYRKLLSASNPKEIGIINLLNFKDWKKTEAIAERLETELEDYNKGHTELYYETIEKENTAFRPVARIREFMERKAASSFLLFLFSFVGILFFISSGVLLHFKLQTEMEREKVKYKKLYKIGITRNEVAETISKELKVLFFLPYFIGVSLAAFYMIPFIKEIGQDAATLSNTLILSIIYFGFQLFYYMIYKRIYIEKITAGAGG